LLRKQQETGIGNILGFSGRGECKLGLDMRFRMGLAVRASRAAGLGAGAEGFVHDFLDGACASAALGAAAQTSVDLPRGARRHQCDADGVAHIVVGEDVAGTNDHGIKARSLDGLTLWIFKTGAGCKRKNRLFKQFQTTALAAP